MSYPQRSRFSSQRSVWARVWVSALFLIDGFARDSSYRLGVILLFTRAAASRNGEHCTTWSMPCADWTGWILWLEIARYHHKHFFTHLAMCCSTIPSVGLNYVGIWSCIAKILRLWRILHYQVSPHSIYGAFQSFKKSLPRIKSLVWVYLAWGFDTLNLPAQHGHLKFYFVINSPLLPEMMGERGYTLIGVYIHC